MTEISTRVVNLKRGEPYDVYIGRAGHGLDGYWGNDVRPEIPCPICRRVHATGRETLLCFDVLFERRLRLPTFRERLAALRGLTLGCFCRPMLGFHGQYRCHGQRYVAYLHGVRPEDVP